MYVVDGSRYFSLSSFDSKEDLYDHCFSQNLTVHQVVERNLRKQMAKQEEKLAKACQGLQNVTKVVTNDQNWQPATEKLTMEVVVAAENALREVENV